MSKEPSIQQLLEPFDIALRLEQEGKKVFEEAAATTTSRLAKQTFEFLAGEEDRHIEKILRFRDSIEASGMANLPETEDSDADEKLKSFNQRLAGLREELGSSESDADAYRRAMDLENGAEEFYAEKMNEASDQRVKRFYKWLIDEEKMHARLLKSCLNFVEDPEEWFRSHKA
jgi:rubrerythrin